MKLRSLRKIGAFRVCTGLTRVPQIHGHLGPVHLALFVSRVFADVINPDEATLNSGGS